MHDEESACFNVKSIKEDTCLMITILTSQGLSAHGFRDPGNPAWAEHFLKLVSLMIYELSLFG